MKKRILATTLLATILLSTNVFAKTIEVTPSQNTIYVDGEKLTTDSFLYQGTTYVPLRAVSESMDSTVNFDSNKKEIRIISQNEILQTRLSALEICLISRDIIDQTATSKAKLVDTLIKEGYDPKIIEIALKNRDYDYNNEALETAQFFVYDEPELFSNDEAIAYGLQKLGFTDSEINYALDNLK